MKRGIVLLVIGVLTIWTAPAAVAFKGKVTVGMREETPSMDPHLILTNTATNAWRWSYDTLLNSQAGTGKIEPWLAEKWERLSASQFKFWLRKGVKFTDGAPVTSEAVKLSFDRIVNPGNKSQQAPFWRLFSRIEILDEHIFILHAKEADNGVINRVARFGHIMSPKAVGMEDKAALSRTTFGSGPYILKSWTKGHSMVLEANPDWWGNRRYPNRPKTFVVRRIQESATRAKALLAGDVDLINDVQDQFVPQIEADPGTRIAASPSVRIMFLGFFTTHGGPMADRNVRLAINHAIDAEQVCKTLLGGRCNPIGGMYHPWNYSGHNPDKKWHGYDPEKAKEHMEKSEYPQGFKATILGTVSSFPADKATCEALPGILKKINIDARCQPMPAALWRKTFTATQQQATDTQQQAKEPTMYYMGWGNSQGDPASPLRAQMGCGGAWSGHCFKDLDQQTEKAAATAVPQQQQLEFEKAMDMAMEKAMYKIFYQVHDVYGVRKDLEYKARHDEMVFPWEIGVK